MASKVLVKIPAVNFNAQIGKCTSELVSASAVAGSRTAPSENQTTVNGSGESYYISVSSDPLLHITQLEQNIKFLKEQHHLMLTSLHHEVETLRQRNRDLQFQLVFNRGSLALLKSSPSSPEDDSKPQVSLSPKQVNVTPLQVEILERDIAELRSSLNEVKIRNSSLEKVIDEQKMQLENAAKPVAVAGELDSSTHTPDPDLVIKLEEAEKIIRRLRRENDEQRRELAMIKANQNKAQSSGCGVVGAAYHRSNHWSQQQHRDQHREHHQLQRDHQQHEQHRDQYREQQREQREPRHDQHRDVTQEFHYDHQEQPLEGSRFPPLTTQKFWPNNSSGQRARWNNSWDSGRVAGGSRMLNQSLPSLPGLPMGSNTTNASHNNTPGSAPFTLLSQGGGGGGGGGRRMHRGNFRGERPGAGRGGNGAMQPGGRNHWDQNREHRGRDRDRHRDQGFNEQS